MTKILDVFLFSSDSLEIYPKEIFISHDEIGYRSIQLKCIITDQSIDDRHHDVLWWHDDKRLGSTTNRRARIEQIKKENSIVSTLTYTAKTQNLLGNYVCESDSLRRIISVQLQNNVPLSRISMKKNSFFLIKTFLFFHFRKLEDFFSSRSFSRDFNIDRN